MRQEGEACAAGGIVISRGYVLGGRVDLLPIFSWLLLIPPARQAIVSRRGEKRNASSIIWIKSFRCNTYSNLKLKMTATFTINNLSTKKIVMAPLHGLSPSLSQQATPHSFIPSSSFLVSSSHFFFIASQSLNSLQPRSSVLVLSSLMICRLKQVYFDFLEHSTSFWFSSHCSSVKL